MTSIHTINRRMANLNSENTCHQLCLYSGNYDAPYWEIPKDTDIVSMSFPAVPQGLETVELHIGGMTMMKFDVDEIVPGANILDVVLPISKAYFMVTQLVFRFGKQFLVEREKWEMIDEEDEHVQYSDNETEFFDGENILMGRCLHRNRFKTGHKVRNIVEDVEVEIPEIQLRLQSGADVNRETAVNIPVWQNLVLNPENDKHFIEALVARQGVESIDGKPIADLIASGRPFVCKAKNYIRFREGMAGLHYVF